MQIIKIPSERVKALLGDSGETKDYLEQRMNVTITVDSDGGVIISGEPLDEFIGKDIIRAIGRGFEPAIALKLLNDSYGLRVIDLRDYVSSRDGLARIKGRVIGEKGRTKEIINEEVGAQVAVWGHTVAVISDLETLDYATNALFKIIEGSPHANVYAYLEKCRRRIKQEEVKKLF
ncbi:MAG: KH domain-containing protein [Candidatus Micrarchaeota archaeon]|nr:KH domain-containing protein [Candidatus Micrarchaeota archaeon]